MADGVKLKIKVKKCILGVLQRIRSAFVELLQYKRET
jgi:hypothetical protein